MGMRRYRGECVQEPVEAGLLYNREGPLAMRRASQMRKRQSLTSTGGGSALKLPRRVLFSALPMMAGIEEPGAFGQVGGTSVPAGNN